MSRKERGTYRGVYVTLVDSESFQQLSPVARHVLLTLRVMREVGLTCIWQYFLEPICQRTGYQPDQVEEALLELQSSVDPDGRPDPWIRREGRLLWIVNGMRHDPTVNLDDPKHRRAVEKWVQSLSKQQIVLDFCDYYGFTRPFDGPPKVLRGSSLDSSKVLQSPSEGSFEALQRPMQTDRLRAIEGPRKGLGRPSEGTRDSGSGSGTDKTLNQKKPLETLGRPSEGSHPFSDETDRKSDILSDKYESEVFTPEEGLRCKRICLSIEARQNGDPRVGGFHPRVCASQLVNGGLSGPEVLQVLLEVLDRWEDIVDPVRYVQEKLDQDFPGHQVRLASEAPVEPEGTVGTFTTLGEVMRRIGSAQQGTV